LTTGRKFRISGNLACPVENYRVHLQLNDFLK
jgi:hypothetical protein